jgi:hypothetical protein
MPVPYAKLDDPQTLNLYSYVYNNPLSGIDMDGHDGCAVEGIGVNCGALNEGAERQLTQLEQTSQRMLNDSMMASMRATGSFKQTKSGGSTPTDRTPYRFVLMPGSENHGSYSYFFYQLENQQGQALKGGGYSVKEHVNTILDRGLQVPLTTSED